MLFQIENTNKEKFLKHGKYSVKKDNNSNKPEGFSSRFELME